MKLKIFAICFFALWIGTAAIPLLPTEGRNLNGFQAIPYRIGLLHPYWLQMIDNFSQFEDTPDVTYD